MQNVHERPRPPEERKSAENGQQRCAEPKPTRCPCASQLHFAGFLPPPEREDGPLVNFLEARPAWWSRAYLCGCLGMDERSLRLQAEHSNGRVIFSSSNGGLRATRHADETEIRSCAAELRNRAASHTRRADEIEQAGGLHR